MEDDQQFCLRWNNHQSTLISVFDTLLENGTLVDCTLAAEGQFLKAHKVVLSACSPYFASLLSQQYDKHPIFILKDVKFQELRAMMDYMYRGEVNISQDQLAALLKAAESLQIKGLSDSRGGGGSSGNNATNAGSSGGQKIIDHNKQPQLSVPVSASGKSSGGVGGVSSGYTLEQKRPRHAMGPLSIDTQELAGSREGSSSPTSRKRKKIRRRSLDNIMADNHELSNSSSHSMQINSSTAPSNTSAAAATTAATSSSSSTSTTSAAAAALLVSAAATGLNVTKKTDNSKMESGVEQDMDNDDETDHHDQHQENNKNIVQMKKEQNHKRKSQVVDTENKDNSDMLIEPKSEYDDGNDETVEDLTLDEEELLDDLEQAGPSHGGEGSSQGYAQWQVDRSQDEVFLAAQEAAGQQRDPQAAEDLSITRIAGLTWDQWNARLAMPLVTQLREGAHPLIFPTDLSISTMEKNLTTSSSIASSMADRKSAFSSPNGSTSSITGAGSCQGSTGIGGCIVGDNNVGNCVRDGDGNLCSTIDNKNSNALSNALGMLGSPGSSLSVSISTMAGLGSTNGSGHPCPECGRVYKLKSSLRNHQKWECGKEPQFQCPFCVYRAKQKMHIGRHMERMHKEKFMKIEDEKLFASVEEVTNLSCNFAYKKENL